MREKQDNQRLSGANPDSLLAYAVFVKDAVKRIPHASAAAIFSSDVNKLSRRSALPAPR